MTEVWLLIDFPESFSKTPGVMHLMYKDQKHLQEMIDSTAQMYREQYQIEIAFTVLSKEESLFPRSVLALGWTNWPEAVKAELIIPEIWAN